MSDFKKFMRDVGYFGIGTAAVIVESGSKAFKALVNKGKKTLRENQDTVDDLKRKARELGDKVKDTVEKATTKPASQATVCPVDAAAMSPEERAELRRQLDEADAACEMDAICEDAPTDDTADRPVAPDVIYHAGAPVAEDAAEDAEKPEETING